MSRTKRVKQLFRATLLRVRRVAWRMFALMQVRPPQKLIGGPAGPLLSVIMPVKNVEDYVAEAINSVLNQNYRNLELIVIDDGSTDRTQQIARSFRRLDPRVHILTTDSLGPGAARNHGIERARGVYLAFVDGDDVLPPRAYERMVTSLEKSGSDVVTGRIYRLEKGRANKVSWNQDESHVRDLSKITIDQNPLLVRDTTSCNKVFRMSHWRAAGISYPAGRLYEDMVPMVQVLMSATKIDVLSASVYQWRIRDEKTSITQRRAEVFNLSEKVDMIRQSLALVETHSELKLAMLAKVFDADLWTYTPYLSQSDTEFDDMFLAAVNEFWTEDVCSTMPLARWVKQFFYAVCRSLGVRQAVALTDWGTEPLQFKTTRVEGNEVYFDPPDIPLGKEIPDEAFRFTRFIKPQATVTAIERVGSRFRILGWAYIPYVNDAAQQSTILSVRTADGGVIDLTTATFHEERVAALSRSRTRDMTYSGFSVEVGAEHVKDSGCELHVTVEAGPLKLSTPLVAMLDDIDPEASYWLSDGHGRLLGAVVDGREPLTFHVRTPTVTVSEVHIADRTVALTSDSDDVDSWYLDLGRDQLAGRVDGRQKIFELPALDRGKINSWALRSKSERDVGVLFDADAVTATGNIAVEPDRVTGGLRIVDRSALIRVTRIVMNGQSVVLQGHGPPSTQGVLQVTERNGRVATFGTWEVGNDGHLRAVVVLESSAADGIARPLASDTYLLQWDEGKADSVPREVKLAEAVTLCSGGTSYSWQRRAKTGIALKITAAKSERETGEYRQWQLRQEYFLDSSGRPEPGVVFLTSFDGRSTACHPGAIGKELANQGHEGTIFVEVVDESIRVPEWATPVIRFTEPWFSAISRSSVVISNTVFPDVVEISNEQFYLQTWHGTPLKKIGNDIQQVVIDRRYLNRTTCEAREMWDALVSPSDFTSEVFPGAFGFEGLLAEIGSPRLDQLVADPLYARHEVRRLYRIDAEARVVLYTPTWRDDGSPSELLDTSEFERQLGPETVLLVRAHPNVLGRIQKQNVSNGSRVIDASRYPVVEDLYSAADILITDYSSTFFDFAVTHRPIIFFTPDLVEYRDAVRGFYFDLETWAPGPILSNTQQVIDLLASGAEQITVDHEQRRRFSARFLAAEDGAASARAIDLFADRISH